MRPPRPLLGLLALLSLGACSAVTSMTGILNGEGPGGAYWYVRDSTSSSRIFYCPPQAQVGTHRCTEAAIVDDEVGVVPDIDSAPAPATVVVPPPPVARGCAADGDCKGGRVCRGGACVQP
jgi:hypothetical protein